jgi:Ni/Co efflux regulator RcnB
MAYRLRIIASVASVLVLASGLALAEPNDEHAHEAPKPAAGAPHPEAHPPEPHPGPSGYQRVQEPEGSKARPATVDRTQYQHNFQAARSFKIGPYHQPPGWHAQHWTYGQTLPRAYWGSQYILSDYWLFALEVPPVGYEWVRDGTDALLVSTTNGEILQVEYGVFG